MATLVWFALGFLAWPLAEYAVHGILAHRVRSFVSPLHWAHHADPHAVFTSPAAWIPLTVGIGALAVWLLGWAPGLALTAGLLAGFLRYEHLHWRIHFRTPRNARERMLRSHHLAHHHCDPRAYHGVSTRFWDRVFRTLPEHWPRDYARVAHRPPLEGRSNLGRLRPVRRSTGAS